jgi:DNA-binding GntR family transcriptional regulator
MQIDNNSLKTLVELVTDTIRTEILHGRFQPGDRLDQAELADELGVSRSPVREALRILTAEDLVTHYRHRGTAVTERSIWELEELLHIRKLLEGSAAERAAVHMTDERLEILKNIIESARSTQDVKQLLELNNSFHTNIYEAYQQPYLIAEIQKMRNRVAPYNRLYLDAEGKKKAWEDHQRIYKACLERDGAKAAYETCLHLETVFKAVVSSIGG